ncbi:hypothetical protein QTO34_008248 [Cnephaeus nilssonii]|uniref:Uncharacterized protein n=1 Tax=Cnephaeus nilssonii TaxID=3371016 RepID=A0AA40I9Y9_CNENI|nr:hypothetical protein QTO34_008248 [Eptesicus nilssonii]
MGPRPSGGQSASLPSLSPAPSEPRRPAPFPTHVVSASGPGQAPWFGSLTRWPSPLPEVWRPHVVGRPEVLGELSEAQDGAGGAVGAALPSSRPISVVASGREMVVLSVPAEVTVILLDIEGTTTPIAFVKLLSPSSIFGMVVHCHTPSFQS